MPEIVTEIHPIGHEAFALTARQRHDALRAILLLQPHNLTLEEAARIAAKSVPHAKAKLTVAELRKLFLDAPGRRKARAIQRRPLTVHNLAWRTARFEKCHGATFVSQIQLAQVRAWFLQLGELSPVSLNNYRRTLHAMFAFAVAEGYCMSNPVAQVPLFAAPPKNPAILTVEQAQLLMGAALETDATLGLLGYVALGLFAGLRRAEIERLDWSAVKWERRMVTVDGSIAKTGSIRNVALSDNAFAWLRLCGRESGRVAPLNLNHRLRRLRKAAGIEKWEGNELRHSFASYHFDLHQNGPLTAAQLGHSSGCQLLFEHYRSLVALGDGLRYFSIGPIVAQKASA